MLRALFSCAVIALRATRRGDASVGDSMTDTQFAERADARGTNHRQSFLSSHRALAACTREFARLSDEIRQSVAALQGVSADEKAAVRQSPDRCIVQLGPVALTIAWLRKGSDLVEA